MRIKNLAPALAHNLKNVYLIGGYSMMFESDWSQFYTPYEIAVSTTYLEEETALRLVRKAVDGRWQFGFKIPPVVQGRISAPVVPINLWAGPNYFHVLIETLPSVLRLIDMGKVTKDTFLVTGQFHPNSDAAVDFIMASAGLRPAKVRLNVGQALLCDNVHTTNFSSRGFVSGDQSITDYSVDGPALVNLRDRFAPLRQTASGSRKLYVRRVSTARNLDNGQRIEELAIAAGYEIVEPQLLSFEEQVRLFASASDIVGATGAWAANLLFAQPGARVHIFQPETARNNVSLWAAIGQALGLNVQDSYCPVTRFWKKHPVHSDFMVPEELVKAVLAGADVSGFTNLEA